MKIAYCVPGTGGAFYCENCIRDCALISGMKALGHDVVVIPVYLPVNHDEGLGRVSAPIAFGAVRIYLEHQFPWLGNFPEWLLKCLDASALLNLAGSLAGSTRAAGHERLTLSMLEAENGVVAKEFKRFASWLTHTVQPDALFISNAFLLGMASSVRQLSDIITVGIAQDEHTWVDSCDQSWRDRIWKAIAEKSRSADILLSFSSWYAQKLHDASGIPDNRISVVSFGVDPSRYTKATLGTRPIRIGYLGRMDRSSGVGILIDAYCQLIGRMNGNIPELSLCGGYTRDDWAFLKEKVDSARLKGIVTVFPDFGIASRRKFLSSLSVLSVPVREPIALGTFIIEAWSAGVAVVQPDQGGFSELVNKTGGGLLYSPNTPEALAEAIEAVLRDDGKRHTMALKGLEAIKTEFNNTRMAEKIMALVENRMKKTALV